MKKKKKHINTNLTIKVDYPSPKLLDFVRDLKLTKEDKLKQLSSDS